LEPQSKPQQVIGLKFGHGLKWLFRLFIKVVGYGGVFGTVNLVHRCCFRVAMSPPTIRPREQADLARYRSFVVKKCGFGF